MKHINSETANCTTSTIRDLPPTQTNHRKNQSFLEHVVRTLNGLPVYVLLRGQECRANPEVIRGSNEVEKLVAFMMAANPAVSRFIGVPELLDGRPGCEKLEEAVCVGLCTYSAPPRA